MSARSLPQAISSTELARAPRPVVETTREGAKRLAALYWREVEATTLGLVRARRSVAGVELRFLGRRPVLVRLGEEQLAAGAGAGSCRFAIAGGLLVRTAGGFIAFDQLGSGPVVLRSTLTEYFPRLTPALYAQVQMRLHALVSRRYFARLRREEAR